MEERDTGSENEVEARAVEAAAIRRRWITLGEILAVLAVLISAMTLWLNWSERSGSQAEKMAENSRAVVRSVTLVLNARSAAGGSRLDVQPSSSEQSVQEQTISFPSPLGVNPVGTTGEPRIEVKWFDRSLKEAREKAGLPDNSRGDERLPVSIKTRFLVGGKAHEDIALYDVGYTVKGRMLGGHDVILRGLSLVKHVKNQSAASELDARWQSILPVKNAN